MQKKLIYLSQVALFLKPEKIEMDRNFLKQYWNGLYQKTSKTYKKIANFDKQFIEKNTKNYIFRKRYHKKLDSIKLLTNNERSKF